MPYVMTDGRLTRGKAVTLQASTTTTTTGNGTGIELGDKPDCRLDLAVTAASGTTPTLNVKIQDSPDNVTWTDIAGATFTQATGVTTQHLKVGPCDRWVRHVATLGGTTPSFTWSLTGEAL